MKKVTLEFFTFFIGMRKFIVMLIFMAVMIYFRTSKYIDGQQFSDNLQLAVVAYFASNFGEHSLDLVKSIFRSKAE